MGINGIDGASASLQPLPINATSTAVQKAGNADRQRDALGALRTETQNQQTSKAGETKEPNKDELTQAVDKIQKFVSATASDIQFSLDEESGVTVVKVIDRSTKEVIRQIPSKEMLELAQALERLQGLLIRQQA